MRSLFALAFGVLTLASCAKNTNPLAANINGKIPDQIDDPLGIGTKPTAPAKQAAPSFIHNAKSPPLAHSLGDAPETLSHCSIKVAAW